MIYRRGVRYLIPVLLALITHSVCAKDAVHLVVKGDTIFSLSRQYKVSQEELMRHNGLSDPSKLQAGMRLSIPSAAPAATAPAPAAAKSAYSEYRVRPNETLYSIARTRGTTLQAILDINGFSKNYVLKAGETIKVPGPAPQVAANTPQPPIARPGTKPVSPAIRWPVSAKEVLYLNSNIGVLVTGEESESIKSLTGGTVVHTSPWRGYGNLAIVEADGGYRYVYGACETLSVRKGDSIEAGTELGKLGIYPASGKPDLVLIVLQNGSPVDPAKAPRF